MSYWPLLCLRSPLIVSSIARADIAEFLLQRGANRNARDGNGRDGLAIADFYKNEEMAKFLHSVRK